MGGDDLGSDDDFYLDERKNQNTGSINNDTEDELDSNSDADEPRRKRSLATYQDGDDSDQDIEVKKNKRKLKNDNPEITPKNLLLQAGRGIADENLKTQAAFIWTCFTNILSLKGISLDGIPKIESSHFTSPKNIASTSNDAESNSNLSLPAYIKSCVSSGKKLKKWTHCNSPMVLIICSSAKRAVSLLKDISSLNIRAAKLFSKHMKVKDQVEMLSQNSYSIGVGTPNRYLKLFETTRGNGKDRALSLEHTQLIIIDSYEDSKGFTVCTLNDTAPDFIMFLHKAILPQLQSRNTIKLSMY
jgi:hypothetical protein